MTRLMAISILMILLLTGCASDRTIDDRGDSQIEPQEETNADNRAMAVDELNEALSTAIEQNDLLDQKRIELEKQIESLTMVASISENLHQSEGGFNEVYLTEAYLEEHPDVTIVNYTESTFNPETLELDDEVRGFKVKDVVVQEDGLNMVAFEGSFVLTGRVIYDEMDDGLSLACSESEFANTLPIPEDWIYNAGYDSNVLSFSITNPEKLLDRIGAENLEKMMLPGENEASYKMIGVFCNYRYVEKPETCIGDSIELVDILYLEEKIDLVFYEFNADDYDHPSGERIFTVSKEQIQNEPAEVLNTMFSERGIEFNNVTYIPDQKRMVVDITEESLLKFEGGSTIGIILMNELATTVLNFPETDQLEVTVEGRRKESGNHFNFSGIYVMKDGKYELVEMD